MLFFIVSPDLKYLLFVVSLAPVLSVHSLLAKVRKAIKANRKAAIDFNNRSGKKFAKPSPSKTPSPVVKRRALAEPTKIYQGELALLLIVKVTNWLLSPNSDRKTVMKHTENNCQSIN